MRSNFFLPSDIPDSSITIDPHTYRVLTGQGVLIRADETYQYVATDGLRSCVAFALINPHKATALLVHFYSLDQVKHGLTAMCDSFFHEINAENRDIVCLILGGREFYQNSVDMVNYIKNDFVRNHILNRVVATSLKIRLCAPIVANNDQTLAVKINLQTGDSDIALNSLSNSSSQTSSPVTTVDSYDAEDELIAFEPIVFTNRIIMNRAFSIIQPVHFKI